MLRTRSSRTLIDPRIAASSIAELDGASTVSTENHLGQTAGLCPAWTAEGGRLSLREHPARTFLF